MASAPQDIGLPLFYKELVPLNSRDHGTWKSTTTDQAHWLVGQHCVPLTVEEFPQAQRHYPIVFSAGDDAVPLALMGLNEGVNVFVDDDGRLREDVYVPAYVRRYPYMLARLTQDATDLTLCFDPTSGLLGEFEEGTALFDGEQPSEACQTTLTFCENFEQAGQMTQAFMDELKKHNLLMDGEVGIQLDGTAAPADPFVYRGFRMIDQTKLKDVRGDVLRTWNQNGMLPLLYAHLFSLDQIRAVFGRQVMQGKGPIPAPVPAETAA